MKGNEDVEQISRNDKVVQFPDNRAVGNKSVEDGSSGPLRTK